MYSLLERHVDGSWWYHPGMTYDTREECEKRFKRSFWWDLGRQHTVLEHTQPLPQQSCCTWDFKTFEAYGEILLDLSVN